MRTLKDQAIIAGIGQTEFSKNSRRSELREADALTVALDLTALEQATADLEMLDEIAHLEDELAGHAGTALPSSLATQHALTCSAPTRSSGGTSARHRSMT